MEGEEGSWERFRFEVRALVETEQLERRLRDTQDPARDEARVLREEAVLTAFVSAILTSTKGLPSGRTPSRVAPYLKQ